MILLFIAMPFFPICINIYLIKKEVIFIMETLILEKELNPEDLDDSIEFGHSRWERNL